MPRGPRLDYPGALHHVLARGIERRKIFLDDRDRNGFLDRLSSLVLNSGAALYAWSLMPNHAHVLLRTGTLPLSRLAQRWLGPYATTFNLVHQRAGHLFQNRFKNTLVEEETYLLTLVAYIHLNPVRSRLPVTIESLDRYPWTGHSVLLGHRDFPAQDTDFVLRQFGCNPIDARVAYRRFMAEQARKGVPNLDGGGLCRSAGGWEFLPQLRRGRERWAFDERILGSSDFVRTVLADQDARVRTPSHEREEHLLNLERTVAKIAGILIDELRSGSCRRRVVLARALFCHIAVRYVGISLTAAARRLGITPASVVRALRRGEKEFATSSWNVTDFLSS